jgi:hypothetical protein
MVTVSDKVKGYLNKRLIDCQGKLSKLKRKRRIMKTCYITTVLLSIGLSSAVSVMAVITLPVYVLSILSAFSALLTAVSTRFNFHDKKTEIKCLIERLHKIKTKLEFVIECNGNLSENDYQQILTEF